MGCPIRVLHAVVNMNRGGAETLIMNLYRNIDREKLQFDFLTCKEGVYDEQIVRMGGRIHRIPYLTDVGHFKYLQELDRFFTTHSDYELVHSHMDKMSGVVLRSAKRAGIPIRISHSHNTSSEGGMFAKAYKTYAGKHILSSATHLFACSTDAANWLFSKRGNSAEILKNGIDAEKFSFNPYIRAKARQALGVQQDQIAIGHVGRFNHQKNHKFIIDVFQQIVESNPNAFLFLVGDGPLRSETENKVVKMNLCDQVRFLGIQSDIHHLMQAFDCILFPSLHEGLPLTLIEAQSAGLPCLISDVISNEVDLGVGLIEFESLKNQPDVWARKLLNHNPIRQDVSHYIKKQGFDIQSSSEWLQQFYLLQTSNLKGAV